MTDDSLIGRHVRVVFASNWPIRSATYLYEGHDADGYWLRNKHGVQRYMVRVNVMEIAPVKELKDELPF